MGARGECQRVRAWGGSGTDGSHAAALRIESDGKVHGEEALATGEDAGGPAVVDNVVLVVGRVVLDHINHLIAPERQLVLLLPNVGERRSHLHHNAQHTGEQALNSSSTTEAHNAHTQRTR